jgi:hypothetical protein
VNAAATARIQRRALPTPIASGDEARQLRATETWTWSENIPVARTSVIVD